MLYHFTCVFVSDEPGVRANEVQDKFRVLLQSDFICPSVVTTQDPSTLTTASVAGNFSDIIQCVTLTFDLAFR